ncbi:hypothetical protein GALMADRAFT_730944 [Galerina marginata CBS 339.88]|uniref:Uncharacterized protein n=1 Tax=Galerina marginata (strain CBS 339.88) TaxID=685588 RepID=A0A067STG9_GALM3|nr:hypothetical protein GALMADRAFT_730944 [Galerina marginata CBS 339.88]
MKLCSSAVALDGFQKKELIVSLFPSSLCFAVWLVCRYWCSSVEEFVSAYVNTLGDFVFAYGTVLVTTTCPTTTAWP